MAKKLVYAKHSPLERCGVAYFAEQLAKQLDAQLVHTYQGFSTCDEFYINLDVLEIPEEEVRSLQSFMQSGHAGKTILIMHDYRFSYVEDQLIKDADVVLNLSGESALNKIAPDKTIQLCTPSLIEEPVLGLTKPSNHPFTLSFGFFSPRKKMFKQYVAFYEHMVKQYPDWHHIIAASGHTGDTSGDSQMLAQMLHAPQVVVTQFMPNAILAELIHAADLGIFFYPTGIMLNNASPMSFFAAGKTVLTTYGELTHPDYKAFTVDGTDFTNIDFSNVAQFAKQGEVAKAYYNEKLSWPVFVQAVQTFLKR